jgi:LacI family transcriptional regulator, gluconate utilization system Gnt-I transcriptional repressor
VKQQALGSPSVGMRDVARRAGVSTITVSRVLASAPNVSADTRARVIKAVEELGYIPNHLARNFGLSRTPLVGVIVPTVANLMFADKIEALAEELRPHGLQLLVTHSAYSTETEAVLVEALVAQRPSGIVLTGVTHSPRVYDLLHRSGIPTVETWNLTSDPIDMVVGFSNRLAAAAMTRHLAECGYRHIGFVHPFTDANDRAVDRLHGYRDAIQELGLPVRPELERASPFGFASGAAALTDLVSNAQPLDGIFFGNDALATGALLECRRRGIRVPDDLGIAGFDDVDLAAQLDPPLTTVRIPMREIGRQTGQLLLARLRDAKLPSTNIDLGYQIIKRGSTRES